jgi:hypothetical protein
MCVLLFLKCLYEFSANSSKRAKVILFHYIHIHIIAVEINQFIVMSIIYYTLKVPVEDNGKNS